METRIRNVDKVTILDLATQLGKHAGEASVAIEVERLVAAGRKRILLNMKDVAFVDSAMLGQLLAAKKTVLMADAELKMLRPRKQVYGLLAQTRLENVFECFEDESSAIRSFRTTDTPAS